MKVGEPFRRSRVALGIPHLGATAPWRFPFTRTPPPSKRIVVDTLDHLLSGRVRNQRVPSRPVPWAAPASLEPPRHSEERAEPEHIQDRDGHSAPCQDDFNLAHGPEALVDRVAGSARQQAYKRNPLWAPLPFTGNERFPSPLPLCLSAPLLPRPSARLSTQGT